MVFWITAQAFLKMGTQIDSTYEEGTSSVCQIFENKTWNSVTSSIPPF